MTRGNQDTWNHRTAAVSNRTIMKAKEKPDGVSEQRWRIELRRRALSKRNVADVARLSVDSPIIIWGSNFKGGRK